MYCFPIDNPRQTYIPRETLADRNFPESRVKLVFAILTFTINRICKRAWSVQYGAWPQAAAVLCCCFLLFFWQVSRLEHTVAMSEKDSPL